MKIRIAKTAENIEYTVLEREGVSDETLQGMFYAPQDGVWTKGYPQR